MSDADTMRREARAVFKEAGLTYAVLTPGSMRRLRAAINERMKASGSIDGTFRCKQRGVVTETQWGRFAELRCKANYFDDREAVTFNTDGFIGFAGWAAKTNVQPILEGFKAWVSEMAGGSTADCEPGSAGEAPGVGGL